MIRIVSHVELSPEKKKIKKLPGSQLNNGVNIRVQSDAYLKVRNPKCGS